jgi:hypothetical protein
MNSCEHEILRMVYALENIRHPEMIPCPCLIRMDPQLSNALDALLDNEYLIVRTDSSDLRLCRSAELFESSCCQNEFLSITSKGVRSLLSGKASGYMGIDSSD